MNLQTKIPLPNSQEMNELEATMQSVGEDMIVMPEKTCVGKQRYVLIVGHQQSFITYYCRSFINLGFAAMKVPTSDGALGCLRLLIFDLVIVDEGIGTFQCRRLLEQARTLSPSPRILVVTSIKHLGSRAEALELGAIDYLQGPIEPPEIARLIDTHLRDGERRQPEDVRC